MGCLHVYVLVCLFVNVFVCVSVCATMSLTSYACLYVSLCMFANKGPSGQGYSFSSGMDVGVGL